MFTLSYTIIIFSNKKSYQRENNKNNKKTSYFYSVLQRIIGFPHSDPAVTAMREFLTERIKLLNCKVDF